jgi:hypothetical protein
MTAWKSWRLIWVVTLLSAVCIVGTGLADADDDEQGGQKGKDKGKGKGPQIVRIDLSQMPKDLAKQVRVYIVDDEPKPEPKKEDKKGKGDKKGKDDKKGAEKGKGDSKGMARIEERLDALLEEIAALRKDLQKKK